MIRKVRREELPQLIPFVFRILSDMDLPLLDVVSGDELNQIIADAMESPQYRYGYEHAWVCEQDNQVVGVLFGYPGEYVSLVDGPFHVALAERGIEPAEVKSGEETHSGEWYLDAIVIAPLYRNQGIARRMLQTIDNIARDAGYRKIGLNCPIENKIAFSLYSDVGFEIRTKTLLGDKVYYHMTKEL
ncbi:MAG TPA: GNAT family N-acetyltransferase [Atopostipes sp.]|nr:GNAT family N-acetyltransferase [Atopostipes sp.]